MPVGLILLMGIFIGAFIGALVVLLYIIANHTHVRNRVFSQERAQKSTNVSSIISLD